MGNPIPVVVVVLDELPVQTLMNPEGNIDSSRYPGFASLLDDFTWYRNTTTMNSFTENVLPMILTGTPAGADLEASSLGYPDNLFTMLANSHDVWAHEELTDFCGPDICAEQTPSGCAGTMAAPAHRHERRRRPCRPPDRSAVSGLPPLDGAWAGFGLGEPTPDTTDPTHTDDEAAVYETFLDSLQTVGPHSLRFLHTLDPHFPWHALPGGLQTVGYFPMRVATDGKGHWYDDQQLVDLAHQSPHAADRLCRQPTRPLPRTDT